ncbi:unnamed protein product [Onchocerca flexuosa]|nr:unnamed protein product [Onchocerca flexuosa]
MISKKQAINCDKEKEAYLGIGCDRSNVNVQRHTAIIDNTEVFVELDTMMMDGRIAAKTSSKQCLPLLSTANNNFACPEAE